MEQQQTKQENLQYQDSKSNDIYKFKLDLTLINLIRSFKHENHTFEKGYLESIYVLLSYYQGNQSAEIFDDYSKNKMGLTLKEIILSIHFGFAGIDNLQEFTTKVENKTEISALQKKSLNSTNILSIHTFTDLKDTLDHDLLNKLQTEIKPNYIENFEVIINDNYEPESFTELPGASPLKQPTEKKEGEKEEEVEKDVSQTKKEEKETQKKDDSDDKTFSIELYYGFIATSIRSKGKLDLYFSTYIAQKLSRKFDLNLYYIMLKFLVQRNKDDVEAQQKSVEEYNLNYSRQFVDICQNVLKLKFDKQIYQQYRDKLINCRVGSQTTQEAYLNTKKELDIILLEIQNFVQNFTVSRDHIQQHYLEKLLIGMLGHPSKEVRNYAVISLNILYDGVDWQLKGPFTCKISHVGRKCHIDYCIESYHDDDIYIQVKSNIFIPTCKQNISTFHKPKVTEFKVINNRRFVIVSLELGRFTRCGFFDWRLVKLKPENLQNVYKIKSKKDFVAEEIKGRYIVHPRTTRDLQIHEVFVDLQNGVQDDRTGKLIQRGNFKTVTQALPEYKKSGVNCLYLMGALERDNLFSVQKEGNRMTYQVNRPDASPLAITCRDQPCQMLGGKEGFKELTKKAKEENIQITVDCLTRISSSRMHKKYKKYMLTTLDTHGKQQSVFGTDGRAVHFEDTSILNYRKKKCWDLFLDEIVQFTKQYGVTGLHLDNGQSWPQIFKLNEDEMYRKEVDGEACYTTKEIFEGKIVEENEDSGYWGSDARDTLPNPFLVKLCRNLWTIYPEFLIISEVWGKIGGFSEAREFSVIQSGPIPRMFKLPLAICQFFGKNLKKDGTITNLKEKKNVSYFKKWYEHTTETLPEGASLIQSTTYHTFPYPALLYKKGSWAAVDLFFFLPDIPMTFIGEKEGKATKVKTTNFFETLKVNQDQIQERILQEQQSDLDDLSPRSSSSIQSGSVFNMSQISDTHQREAKKSLQRVDSSFFDQHDDDHHHGTPGTFSISRDRKKSSSYVQLADMEKPHYDELQVVSQEGWGFIQSLKDIKHHYAHRAQLRHTKQPLKRGRFVPLTFEHIYDSSNIHSHVLVFARYIKKEMAIVIINFNEEKISGKINFQNLYKYFPNYQNSKTVFELEDWIDPSNTQKYNLFYASEILDSRYIVHLNTFQSQVLGLKIYENDTVKTNLAMEHSYQRLLQNMSFPDPQEIESNDIAMRLYKLVKETDSTQEFLNGFCFLYQKYYHAMDLNNLISLIKPFKDDNITKNKLFAYFKTILQLEDLQEFKTEEEKKEFKDQLVKTLGVYDTIDKLIKGNTLGSICIATPEYGKWTKTGGLGVMTDELSRGLADLGEEVYVITPYYEDKRLKNPNQLEADGFKYVKTINYWIGEENYEVGIHYGKIKGVHIYFLMNCQLFPQAFCGDEARYVVKQLTLYAKVTLQLLCDIKVIPSIMVTNDWFSGFIPAYIKKHAFGDVFNTSRVFHIAHNLDPSYEGRLWPKHDENYLEWIHQLDYDWLVDKSWEKTIINPSRCAFITCDNWGTVSHSYKYELLEKSPLRPLLQQKPHAFSFPNGLNMKERLQFIIEATGNDHLKAKEQLQKKYFGLPKLNNKIPLFGFVGRITEQKGVHLILDGIHQLIQETNYKVQIILGGMANEKEPYAKDCADKIRSLRQQYPNNFWGDPGLFFRDGPLLNCGCDYGLMPSKFEPGGIVQHEFFIASTPVVATKTGGLQDTVWEYNVQTKKGSGFNFTEHTWFHLVQAMKRAIKIFKDPREYKILRKNAYEATIDSSDVCRAYAMEFYRMFNKIFLDKDLLENLKEKMSHTFKLDDFKPVDNCQKGNGTVINKKAVMMNRFEKLLQTGEVAEKKQIAFKFKPQKGTFPRAVQIIGSFDDWEQTYDLKYDQFSQQFKISLSLKPGDYQYKYKIDDQWMINPDEPQDQDQFLNVNNVIRYEQFQDQLPSNQDKTQIKI